MARPEGGYVNAAGKRVPGVTTITGRFKDSGKLIHWAWSEGREGRSLYEKRDAAADAGSLCHDMIEATILSKPMPDESGYSDDLRKMAREGYEAFQWWWDGSRIEVTQTETPLVSERHQYGGTLDAIGLCGDRLVLLDWKTSNGIYPEYLLQLAAYLELWWEHQAQTISEAHLLRVGKEHGDFHHHAWRGKSLVVAREQFLALRECYERDKVLKRLAK